MRPTNQCYSLERFQDRTIMPIIISAIALLAITPQYYKICVALSMKGIGAVAGLQERSSSDDNLPAYPGSRFNTDGFCIKHDTVRLCKVTKNVGKFTKYQILQKFCPECAGHPKVTTTALPRLLDGAALSLISNQNTPKVANPTHINKQSTRRHKSRSQERFRGERGNLHHPQPPRQRRSQSQPCKGVERKQLPKISEGDNPRPSTTSKLVDEIIKQIKISPPPKDLHTAPTTTYTAPKSSSTNQSLASSADADLKQQICDLSGLLNSIQMNDSADKLLSTIDIPARPHLESKDEVKSYNTIRDDASAKYLFRKSKRDQLSTRDHGEKVVAFKQYLESVPVPASSKEM